MCVCISINVYVLAVPAFVEEVCILVVQYCTYRKSLEGNKLLQSSIFVTGSGKTGLIHTSTEIQFLSTSERYTHALPRNTKYLAIDGQVCFYRWLFADAVKPRRCMSWSWGVSIGLHGVPNCSSRQSGPPLWIVPVHVTY